MKRRGQFFLIAALIIISIIMGFSVIYNSAAANKPDTKAARLAETIKYEGIQVINNGYINEKDSSIPENINSLVKVYAQSNPEIEINIIEEETKDKFKHKFFQDNRNNQPYIKENTITLSADKKLTVTIQNGLSYTFDNTHSIHDIYVIVKKEGNNERFISAK
ncbi:MAG: hypothetical protein AABW75_04040 [Nanoarchaeota archaeon]|mgnify:CR=1 FL=1